MYNVIEQDYQNEQIGCFITVNNIIIFHQEVADCTK